MAKRILFKIWSVLISSLALFASGTNKAQGKINPPEQINAVWQIQPKRSEKPDLFLEQATAQGTDNFLMAGHRSHSSHRSHASHASHRSHYSGSGGSAPLTESPSSPPAVQSPGTQRDTSPKAKEPPGTPQTSFPVKRIFMKNGMHFNCENAWRSEGKMYFRQDGKIYSMPMDDIDVEKTMNEGGMKIK